VARQTEKPRDRSTAVIEMRRELASKIATHAQSLGENPTVIPGLALYRRTTPTACLWPPTNLALLFSYRDESASTSEGPSTSVTDRPFSCRRSMFLPRVKSSKLQNRSPAVDVLPT